MIHGLHLYGAFFPKRCAMDASHSHTHSMQGQPALQEQLGVRCLAQGHWHTRGGIELATLRLPDDHNMWFKMVFYECYLAYIRSVLYWMHVLSSLASPRTWRAKRMFTGAQPSEPCAGSPMWVLSFSVLLQPVHVRYHSDVKGGSVFILSSCRRPCCRPSSATWSRLSWTRCRVCPALLWSPHWSVCLFQACFMSHKG